MPASAVTIEPFDFAHASEQEYQAINHFSNIMQVETLPDDPPTPLTETIADLQNVPSFIRAFAWAAWNPDHTEIIGSANAGFMDTEENRHLVWCDLGVLPQHRRQGIGRRLLAEIAAVPEREGRRLMVAGTNTRVPAGEAFMEKLSGERAMETHTNQLVLADLDRALLAQWMTPDASRWKLGKERTPKTCCRRSRRSAKAR